MRDEKSKQLQKLLQEVCSEYTSGIVFSTSLSMEDQVITHHIFSNNLPVSVFTLDTGRLFPETYKVLENTRNRYKKPIQVFFPNHSKVEELVNNKGMFSFYESPEDRKTCCHIRKVEPLNRALKGANVWITGLRSEHSESRSGLSIFEQDTTRQLVKVNPLLDWTTEDITAEIKRHSIPYNPLHDKGFISIGCQPCTRAVKAGDDFRSGRWWWEDKSKKECGLHTTN